MSIPSDPPELPLCPKGCEPDWDNPVEKDAGNWYCPVCRSFFTGSQTEWLAFADHRERLSSNPLNVLSNPNQGASE